jgi:sec-independent protein translocase protein TatA
MGSDLFAPWHIIILVIVLVLLFGARRLPGAAHSLGKSMHIFRRSVQGLYNDDDGDSAANPMGASTFAAPPPPAVTAAPPAVDSTQQQLADLQRQVADLQRHSSGTNGQASEAQSTRPI